jgi:hypothetical protein
VNQPIQLTFGGGRVVPQVKPRAGCIGKVERLIDERPWLTAGEIAQTVGEPAGRVSMALNKLKHEGRAQQQAGLGQHRRMVWAGTSGAGRETREARLLEATAASDEEMGRKMAERLPRAFLRAGSGGSALEC